MDVDEPVPTPSIAPIASSAAAAAASLLDLFAVASSPPVPHPPVLPQIVTNGVDANDNTESEGEGDPASDEGEGDEEELPAAKEPSVDVPEKRNTRARPAEDRPVSPISQEGDEAEGASREVSPVSERSVDEAEEDGDEPDDGEPDGDKSDGEPEVEDAVDKSDEEDADLEDPPDKSNAKVDDADVDVKSDIEADVEADADKSELWACASTDQQTCVVIDCAVG